MYIHYFCYLKITRLSRYILKEWHGSINFIHHYLQHVIYPAAATDFLSNKLAQCVFARSNFYQSLWTCLNLHISSLGHQFPNPHFTRATLLLIARRKSNRYNVFRSRVSFIVSQDSPSYFAMAAMAALFLSDVDNYNSCLELNVVL